MSYLPVTPVVNEITNITNEISNITNVSECDLSKLEELTLMNMKCCEFNSKLLININNKLVRYDEVFRKLLECCNPPSGDTGVIIDRPIRVIPGQIVNPPPTTTSSRIEVVNKRVPREILEVDYKSYDTPFYPHSPIMYIPGEYRVVDDKYVDKSGVDLRRWLPYELNIKNGDIILEAILDYRILLGGGLYLKKDVMLIYKTRNITNNVVTTFEAGVGHYKKWWEIHSGRKVN
jgi:hypothetical protein